MPEEKQAQNTEPTDNNQQGNPETNNQETNEGNQGSPKSRQAQMSTEEIINHPEVQSLLEKARSQEKDKMYNTLEKRNEQIRELESTVEELEQEKKELKDALEGKKEEEMSELDKAQEEINELKSQISDLTKTYEEDKQKTLQEKKQAELQAYKERRIREVRDEGDDLVEGLVSGDSKEAIDQSIEIAKQEFEHIKEKAQAEKKNSKPRQTARTTNPSIDTPSELSSSDVKNMSLEEYKNRRQELIEKAKNGQLG